MLFEEITILKLCVRKIKVFVNKLFNNLFMK